MKNRSPDGEQPSPLGALTSPATVTLAGVSVKSWSAGVQSPPLPMAMRILNE